MSRSQIAIRIYDPEFISMVIDITNSDIN